LTYQKFALFRRPKITDRAERAGNRKICRWLAFKRSI